LILAVIGDIGCDGALTEPLEFDGETVYALNIEERMTLCNMVIEAGGKNGVIAPDQVTLDYVNARNAGQKPYTRCLATRAPLFSFEKVYDVSKLEPVVAQPHSPDNRAYVSEIRGTKLDRAYIGSCTGGQADGFPGGRQHSQRQVRSHRHVRRAGHQRDHGGSEKGKNQRQTLEEVFLAAGAKLDSRAVPHAWAGRATPWPAHGP